MITQERLKQWSIGWRDPLYTLLLFLGCIAALALTVAVVIGVIYLIPALKDWQHANAATTVMYEKGLGTVVEAAESIKAGALEVAPTLQGLQGVEKESKEFIADMRIETRGLMRGVDARLLTLDTLLVSFRGVSEEGRSQVKQNGDQIARTLKSAEATIDDVGVLIKNTDREATRMIQAGTLMIETANPRLQELLAHADNVIITADGTIKAYEPVGVNLAGITSDFNAMTTDSKNKLHELLYPVPKHGWARAGQVATYALKPIWDGVRLYYSLTSLPVRLTQPIPLK